MNSDQNKLWELVYSIIRINPTRDTSINACLNFLANGRRTGKGTIEINENTALIREET